jgi:hypothetical protein
MPNHAKEHKLLKAPNHVLQAIQPANMSPAYRLTALEYRFPQLSGNSSLHACLAFQALLDIPGHVNIQGNIGFPCHGCLWQIGLQRSFLPSF